MTPEAELMEEILRELKISNRLKAVELNITVNLSLAGRETRDRMIHDVFEAFSFYDADKLKSKQAR